MYSADVFDAHTWELFPDAVGWASGLHAPALRYFAGLVIVCTSETTRLLTDEGEEYVLPGIVWPTQYGALTWLNSLPGDFKDADLLGFKPV